MEPIKRSGIRRIEMNIKIAVATHKEYQMPKSDMYLPMLVGSDFNKIDVNYQKDNTGDNISYKNKNYCELTAAYWLWKNSDADIKGLVHYRRYFMSASFKSKNLENILSEKDLLNYMNTEDILVPKLRKYYIETLWSHYKHSHHIEGLEVTRKIIKKNHPTYLESFDEVMNRRSAHMFNMMVMKKELFDQYHEWLFSILFEVENNIDISNYSVSEARIFGYISELLLDVWLDKNKLSYKEVTVKFMEKQNWITKIGLFIHKKVFKPVIK